MMPGLGALAGPCPLGYSSLAKLRKFGVVCHIGDLFYRAAGCPDELILVAPCKSAKAQMLDTKIRVY